MEWIDIASGIVLLSLLALAVMADLRERRLPDVFTMPLIVLGLVVQLSKGSWPALAEGVTGAIAGLISLWSVAALYRALRGGEGLGLGDAKLLAAAGAWLGPWLLPPLVLAASILALVQVGYQQLRGTVTMTTAVPFGPALGIAFFALWCIKLSGDA